MERIRKQEEKKSFAEEADSLWRITFAPSLWALHFLVCYGATAIVCGKFGGDESAVWLLRAGIGAMTALALGGIGFIAWRSWIRWDFLDDHDYEHALAQDEHRHEFLGHASFLLSVISLVGVAYGAMPALVLEACR